MRKFTGVFKSVFGISLSVLANVAVPAEKLASALANEVRVGRLCAAVP